MSTETPPRTPPQPPQALHYATPSDPARPPRRKLSLVINETLAGVRQFISHPQNRLGVGACTAMMLVFMILSFSAVLTKSPTYDEPLHAMGAWANLRLGDFRINFEDPPLWKYWAAIPNGRNSVLFEPDLESWVNMPQLVYRGWDFANHTLFQTPGTNGAAFVNRSRFMMLLLGVMLGIVLVIWAWQLGGPVAAIVASVLFALDPNLLGHAALVKNDVPMALLMAAVFFAMWRAGQKLTWLNAAILAILVAMAVNTKFSALLLAPMLIVIVGVRTLLPIPWVVLGRTYASLFAKTITASLLLLATVIITYLGIWASYGFRYNPSPDPSIQLNTLQHKVEALKYRFQSTHPPTEIRPFDPTISLRQYAEELQAQLGRTFALFNEVAAALKDAPLSDNTRAMVAGSLRKAEQDIRQFDADAVSASSWVRTVPPSGEDPTAYTQKKAEVMKETYKSLSNALDVEYTLRLTQYAEKVGDDAPDSFITFLNFFFDHHLLPSPWLNGVLFVHARSMIRGSYLLGATSPTGWWYYFPLAALFKTPVATLGVLFTALGIGIWVAASKYRQWTRFAWPLACLLVPFAIYVFSAMTSNLNIGIRHILPMYPLVYIATGVLAAFALRRRRQIALISMGAFGILLLAEALNAYPSYLAYFNFVSRIASDPLNLLADSNLDWGQDLPLVKKWQDNHPGVPLAFGPWMKLQDADGKNYTGSYFGTVDPVYYGIKSDPLYAYQYDPTLPETHVLAISATFLQGVYGGPFVRYKDVPPTEVLGGTIYLYDQRTKR